MIRKQTIPKLTCLLGLTGALLMAPVAAVAQEEADEDLGMLTRHRQEQGGPEPLCVELRR